jgi:hypothetical protein
LIAVDCVERAAERSAGRPDGSVAVSAAVTDPEPAIVTKLRTPGTALDETVLPDVVIAVLPAGTAWPGVAGDDVAIVPSLHAATPSAKSAKSSVRRF